MHSDEKLTSISELSRR